MSLPIADPKAYLALIAAFIEGRLRPDEFEVIYLYMFKNDGNHYSDSMYEVLNTLFIAVDAYCPDETIRDEGDLDASQLRDQASSALSRLRALTTSEGE